MKVFMVTPRGVAVEKQLPDQNVYRGRRAAAVAVLGLGLLAFLLFGCATSMPQRVEIPVPVPCKAPAVEKPSLPVDAVDPKAATVFDYDRALWATVETLEGYAAQLEAALDACR